MNKQLLIWQNYLLTTGMLFAGYNVVTVTMRYLNADGVMTAFRASNGLINPLATPCFYGFLAFGLAWVWSTRLRARFIEASQSNLVWLLTGASIFAWGNYGYTLGKLYTGASCNLGCTAGYFGIPQFTTCLVGAVIFTLALIVAVRAKKIATRG